jgi:hypothetical protein
MIRNYGRHGSVCGGFSPFLTTARFPNLKPRVACLARTPRSTSNPRALLRCVSRRTQVYGMPHNHIWRFSPELGTSRRPSRENARLFVPPSRSSVRTSFPSSDRHNLTVSSSEPEASSCPSGENATLFTRFVCPFNVPTSWIWSTFDTTILTVVDCFCGDSARCGRGRKDWCPEKYGKERGVLETLWDSPRAGLRVVSS